MIDVFQGGFITKEEFEERSRTVATRIAELQDDLNGLQTQRKEASEGNEMLSKIGNFTSRITSRLDDMSFHERQTLALRAAAQLDDQYDDLFDR